MSCVTYGDVMCHIGKAGGEGMLRAPHLNPHMMGEMKRSPVPFASPAGEDAGEDADSQARSR